MEEITNKEININVDKVIMRDPIIKLCMFPSYDPKLK